MMYITTGCASPRTKMQPASPTLARSDSSGARGDFQKNCVRPQGLHQRCCEAQLKKLCLQYAVVRLSLRCLHEARRRMCITAVIHWQRLGPLGVLSVKVPPAHTPRGNSAAPANKYTHPWYAVRDSIGAYIHISGAVDPPHM